MSRPIDRVLERLAVLEREHAALKRSVAELQAQNERRCPDDRAILLALATAARDAAFTARTLLERAALVDPDLRRVLLAADLGSARRLGAWLRGMQDAALGGMRVERLGRDEDGALWIIRVAA